MTNLIFEDPLEDIDNPRLLPYDGEYQCYHWYSFSGEDAVSYHGDQADFLWRMEFHPGGVECVNAGWYDLLFVLLGLFDEAEILDNTSSAGDWCLAFKVGKLWYPAWQENMYPTKGYRWTISHEFPARDLEDLWAILTME